MVVITAPNEVHSIDVNNNFKLFLAGGITNCSDWQSEIIKKLKKDVVNLSSMEVVPQDNNSHIEFDSFTIYNPRRKKFPMDNSKEAERQIVWEYNHLKEADIIAFWFAYGTDNPIVLYELGMWGNSRNKKIVIGVDPKYKRKYDVIIQAGLAKPSITVATTFYLFYEMIILEMNNLILEKTI